ncbi:hypothetical protein [Methanomethylovorans sp.]|uniref:hypothetical protein n=1 Tax=Methanomethylovorans sp. TaxID=2758717 RepID=UPI003D0B2223
MTALSKTILKAKASVEKRAGTAGRWTRTSASNGRISLYVLLDKQPVGYVLADHTRNLVRSFDSELRHISTHRPMESGKIASVHRCPPRSRPKKGVQLPSLVNQMCISWQEKNGYINAENYHDCLVSIIRDIENVYGMSVGAVGLAIDAVVKTGKIKKCSCCGAVPAKNKKVNGDSYDLCAQCEGLLFFQDLGPKEGYT